MGVKHILVFLPDSLDTRKSGYLKGRKELVENNEVFYISSDKVSLSTYQSIGFLGSDSEFKFLNEDLNLHINRIHRKISVGYSNPNLPVTQIIYDYKRFKNSDIVYNNSDKYGKHFMNLCKDLRQHDHLVLENGKNFFTKFLINIMFILDIFISITTKLNKIVQKSTTFIHFEESLNSMKWFLKSTLKDKKITPNMGNVLVNKPIDIAIGVFLTCYVMQYEDKIFMFLYNSMEVIISSLKGLLFYLMGSPIGLKLNYGLNNFLGQFFLYHISLWRIFLHGTYPILTNNFKYLVLPGVLGFSYQIAMISDIISIATFHSYCIYINGARLFNFQLKCLTSLWRVLIGRKFNPLRNRVDSCQYSQNQMFIGTLSFTVLLFLLPTTIMYYVVFSVFRLVILFIDRLLLTIRNMLYNIPIYSIFLWLINSSSVAGNMHIHWKSFDEMGNVIIEAKLEKLPFMTIIQKFKPSLVSTGKKHKPWRDIFHNTLTGTVL